MSLAALRDAWRRRSRRRRGLGPRGERVAAGWLRRRGYRILHRNLRLGRDELDLVALDPDGRTIVIVEVKTRRVGRVAPEASVDGVKQRRLVRAAMRLEQSVYPDRPLRFDTIAVQWPAAGRPRVRHTPDAFES